MRPWLIVGWVRVAGWVVILTAPPAAIDQCLSVCVCLSVCECREFAKDWDSVEMTLHFTTLLAARLTWDNKVKKVLQLIKKRGGHAFYVCMYVPRHLSSLSLMSVRVCQWTGRPSTWRKGCAAT